MRVVRYVVRTARRALLLDSLSSGAQSIVDGAKGLLNQQSQEGDSEDAQKAFEAPELFGITPKNMRIARKHLWRMTVLYLVLSFFVGAYTVALFRSHSFAPAFMTSGVLAICLAQAFRNHFWYFQVKSQRLGCTFSEWLGYVLKKLWRGK